MKKSALYLATCLALLSPCFGSSNASATPLPADDSDRFFMTLSNGFVVTSFFISEGDTSSHFTFHGNPVIPDTIVLTNPDGSVADIFTVILDDPRLGGPANEGIGTLTSDGGGAPLAPPSGPFVSLPVTSDPVDITNYVWAPGSGFEVFIQHELAPVPETSTIALMMGGLVALYSVRRRQRRAS